MGDRGTGGATATSSLTSQIAPKVTFITGQVMVGQVLVGVLERHGYGVTLLLAAHDAGWSVAEVVASTTRRRCDAVVISDDCLTFDALTAVVQRLTAAGVSVVVLTTSTRRRMWGRYLLAGARTVVPYSSTLPDLLAAVRATVAGRSALSREDREALMREWSTHAREHADVEQRLARLTLRERAVLDGLVLGHSVTEIAKENVVAVGTVRTQVKAILSKLEVSSQIGAVGLVHQVASVTSAA